MWWLRLSAKDGSSAVISVGIVPAPLLRKAFMAGMSRLSIWSATTRAIKAA